MASDAKQLRSEAFDQMRDALWIVETDGHVLDANPMGRELLAWLGGDDDWVDDPQLLDAIAGTEPACVRVSLAALPNERESGERVLDVECVGSPDWPETLRAVVLRDVTRAHEFERQQSILANYDSLTGLPNLRLFERQLDESLERADGNGTCVALLLLDLDQFKQTNDSMGHVAGDQLLAHVAQAIRGVVRGRDVVSRLAAAPEDRNVARLGGDEFAIILGDVARSEDTTDIAARVLQSLREPVEINGAPLVPSASIGVAVYPQDASTAGALREAADQALYKAKELGRNQCQLYHPALNDRAGRRREVARELARAIDDEALEVVYQPLVGLRGLEVRGAEALVRWTHPELGAVSPAEFVDIAEKTGLVDRLGRLVLDRTLSDIAKHADEAFDWRIAVNVSHIELKSPRYARRVAEQIEAHGVDARHLELEITERAFLAHCDAVASNLRELRRMGVRVQLDDFGTGRSSLSDLLEHRLDGVKIDRTFVTRHPHDRVAARVLRAVLEMAGELRIHVVAQGVESAEEAASLRSYGCEEGQGFWLSPPVAAADYFAVAGCPIEPAGAGAESSSDA